ncbi:unnamed protein product [Symbiodinium natans]|uniref:Uncharacterized protein n=1 Tax=Symbiodinium natans TaxID=878477 RepID=A0A812GM45_9DINO|nr:unnamed protein product [Symbiodinium natans]
MSSGTETFLPAWRPQQIRRLSMRNRAAADARSRPAIDLEVCGSQNLHMSRPSRLCPKSSGMFIKASPRRSSCELQWLPAEAPALEAGSPCSDCSVPPVDSFATRLAAPLARALVEHFGSLDRAFAAVARGSTGRLRRDDWLRELEPLQDQIEDIGPSLGKFFTMIQAVGTARVADVVTCDDWHSFFFQCLAGSHAERLLDQDLGPRRHSCPPRPRPPTLATADCGKEQRSPGSNELKVLMSPEQVQLELKRRYSSTGCCSLHLTHLSQLRVSQHGYNCSAPLAELAAQGPPQV